MSAIHKSVVRVSVVGLIALLTTGCATHSSGQTRPGWNRSGWNRSNWTTKTLSAALATPTRSQADRDLDADRKPAELMNFFGVKPGMNVVELMAGRGYLTEVLSITVGPTGKVFAQNQGADKTLEARLADNRLPNVQHVNAMAIPTAPESADLIITAMNLHDVYNKDPTLAQAAVKYFYTLLKANGTFAVVDHVGIEGADNAKLHRMQKQQAIDLATAAGFIVEKESDLLSHSTDDHTKRVDDPSIRWKTDQFVLKFKKPK